MPARSSSIVALALLGAGLGACSAPSADAPLAASSDAITKCAAGVTVQGIDVSSHQGAIDWPRVKAAGVSFAIARISDGSYQDTRFATNWADIAGVGLVRGAYQYFEPGQDPLAQADTVVQKVGRLGPRDLPVTLDVEATGGQTPATIAARIRQWVDVVEAGTGKTPMIYTSSGFWNPNVATTAFSTLPLWAAHWQVSCPSLASGWTDWKVWQYSDSGSVDGVTGAVDLDEFNGSLAELEAFAAAGTSTWGAAYVSQSYPLATTTIVMTAGETRTGYLELRNTGTNAWDANTRLATTMPRDRASAFVAPDWIDATRPSAVVGAIPNGGTFKFELTLHAPAIEGVYPEFFGVVQEGVAWFSDPGQLGPPDGQLEVKIRVVAPEGGLPDAASDASEPSDASDDAADDAAPVVDAADEASRDSSDDAAGDAVFASDAATTDAEPDDAGPPDAGARDAGSRASTSDGVGSSGGCSLAPRGSSRGHAFAVALAVVAALIARRRARTSRT